MKLTKSQEGKIDKPKTPFEVEDLRTKLAIKNRYDAFIKTYSAEYPEVKAENTNVFWNKKFKVPTTFSELDPMTKEKINTIISFLPNKKIRILDLGIGQGYLEQKLQQIGKNYEIWGIDISKKAISQAKEKFKGKFNIGNVLKIKNYYERNFFDVIVAIELIEHISPRKNFAFYKAIYSLLKPRGILILSTPLNEGLRYGIENLSSHVREYTEPILRAELKISKFKIVEKRYLFAFINFYRLKRVLSKIFRGRWGANNIVVVAKKA